MTEERESLRLYLKDSPKTRNFETVKCFPHSNNLHFWFKVSWMRSRDLHILTSGNFSFSSDARFGPQHTPGSDAWTLKLDNARKTDSGKYECQVNTEPKIMYAVQLSVRGDCRSTSHFVLHVCSPIRRFTIEKFDIFVFMQIKITIFIWRSLNVLTPQRNAIIQTYKNGTSLLKKNTFNTYLSWKNETIYLLQHIV